MYISYANLWKTLIDKRISKTELMNLTGMSSRTIAKLSRNQTVTTETLLHICEALDCTLADVMEVCEGETDLSIFDAFHDDKELLEEDDFFNTYRLRYRDTVYRIRKTKKCANKHTVIHCGEQGSVIWEQLYPMGHTPISEKTVIGQKTFARKEEQGILLITGSPGCISGLDENGFVSARGHKQNEDDVYVMTYAAFKLFMNGEKEKE